MSRARARLPRARWWRPLSTPLSWTERAVRVMDDPSVDVGRGDERGERGDVLVGAIRLRNDSESVGVSRTWLRDLLARARVHPECIDVAVLIISELVSNAIRHGRGHVLCHAVIDRDACTLSVFDFGDGEPTVVDRSPETIGGLGLIIVQRLSSAWGVTPYVGGKAVYAVLDADSERSARDNVHAVA